MDPVVLFFALGVIAKLAKSDLRMPEALYESLSIFLLLAIGIKGGVELAKAPVAQVLPQAAAATALGIAVPFALFPVLARLGRLARPDAASIAAHYGSISIVTFAVGTSFLARNNVAAESYMPLFAALMESPGIIAGILLARIGSGRRIAWGPLAHEVFVGKSVLLLIGGLAIGAIAGPDGIGPIKPLFLDLFKGLLALFLLEMGLVAGGRLGDLKRAGVFLIVFGLAVPPVLGLVGALFGHAIGLSVGGSALLATLVASASYIAAPTAMRIAVPEANPALSIGVALGVTFPFNITLGVPLYLHYARWIGGAG
ncbi:MAG: sodium-dependent bicarbonate transport family permease [Burkholderiales bacterium]|jgi:hypothetical protein|nr:sodium-dependent bicarbonate transport family permease [Burkholderiales bacterium]